MKGFSNRVNGKRENLMRYETPPSSSVDKLKVKEKKCV